VTYAPPLSTIHATTRPTPRELARFVDVASIEHLAYPTARRTLFLEQFVNQCSTTRLATSTCATCAHVCNRMKRARPNDPIEIGRAHV
jgi:hypothetical protein